MDTSAGTQASALEAKKWPNSAISQYLQLSKSLPPSRLLPGVTLLGINDPEKKLFSRHCDLALNQLNQKFESEINVSLH